MSIDLVWICVWIGGLICLIWFVVLGVVFVFWCDVECVFYVCFWVVVDGLDDF